MGEEHSKQQKKSNDPPNEVKPDPNNQSPSGNQQPKINEDLNNNINLNNNNNILNNINFPGVTGGNSSKKEKPKIKINDDLNMDLDIKSEDNRRYKRFNKIVNKNYNNNVNKNKNNNNQNNNMVNKLEKKKNLNIEVDQNNNNEIKIDPMMMTDDNSHSKKIVFHKNEVQNKKVEIKKYIIPNQNLEIKKNIIENKKEEDIKKNNSPIKNVMQNFRNNNDNNDNNNINKNLNSNRKIHPRRFNLNASHNEINNYRENYNTINNDEDQISNIRRHNLIRPTPFLKKLGKPKIKIDDNPNNQNKNILNNEIKGNENQDNIEENLNINNEIKNNDNLNINEEIKKNENKEEENLDLNININNLIENKQNKNNNNNNYNRNIEEESNQSRSERRMKRSISYSNLNLDSITPQKVFLFDNYNIFDSILIILSNNTYISKYFTKNQNKIYNCEKNNQYCLSIILHYINKYLWTKKPELIIKKKDLNSKYQDFLNCYLEKNCNNSNPELYLHNTDNLETMIYFIYYKINVEITAEHKNKQTFDFGTGNSLLNHFMNDFFKNNKSVISDFFTGFYQEEFFCINCKNRMERYGNIYIPYRKYSSFNYIYFDLKNIGNQYAYQYGGYNTFKRSISVCEYGNNINQYSNINFTNNININIYNCINQEFEKYFQQACNLCQLNTQKYLKKQFYSLPKVLTIIVNNKNANFIVNDQINLSQFTHIQGNNNYYLIAMLCKYTYNNQLITYCFNPKDGNWYYYTKIEGLFSKNNKKTTFLEPNAIPYVLVYQDTENMDFEYNEINLEIANNKKGYLFRFQNGIPQATLYFGINATVKEVTKAIASYYKLDKVRLLINANQIKDDDILSVVAENNLSILVITV